MLLFVFLLPWKSSYIRNWNMELIPYITFYIFLCLGTDSDVSVPIRDVDKIGLFCILK